MTALIAPQPLFNWFDLALVLVLAFGFWRGRKHGMSREFLPVTQWLATLGAGGFGYAPLGRWLIQTGVIHSVFGHQFNQLTAAFVTAYLIILLAVAVVFSGIKRRVKARLEGSDFFGGGEYYLGALAGGIHCAALLLVGLALLNAPIYTAEEVAAHKKFMMENFGLQGGQQGNFKSEEISGDYFPTWQTIQSGVFQDSLAGPFVKDHLRWFLINTALQPSPHQTGHP